MAIIKNLVVGVIISMASPVFAIGTTDCASGDGQTRRTEWEVWGANPIKWEYRGELVPAHKVKLEPTATVIVSDVVTQHPDLGEEHRLTTVELAVLTLADGRTVTEYVLCKTIEYPNVLD